MVKRYELSEAQWRRIEDLLPGSWGDPGRTGRDNRLFVNGVFWVLRSGARWQPRSRPAEAGRRKKQSPSGHIGQFGVGRDYREVGVCPIVCVSVSAGIFFAASAR